MTNGTSDPHNGYTAAATPSDIDAAIFLGNIQIDNLHTVVMTLASEIWSMRRRQKIVETLLATRGVVTAHAIETFVPSKTEEAAWQAERDLFIRSVYDPLQRTEGVAYHRSLVQPASPS